MQRNWIGASALQALLLAVVLSALLAGCNYSVMNLENSSSWDWHSSFYLKGGTESNTFTIQEGETPEARFSMELTSGSADIRIEDSSGAAVYEAGGIQKSSFAVELTEKEKYRIILTFDKASGSYYISWGDPPEKEETP